MKPLGLIFDNFGLKLLAVLMAWAVWYMARANLSAEDELVVDVVVHVDEGAANVQATPKQKRVRVSVDGPSSEVTALSSRAGLTAVITLPQQPESEPGGWEDIRLADVVFPEFAKFEGVRIVKMEPDAINVRWDRIDTRDVPVQRPEVKENFLGATVQIIRCDTTATVRATRSDLTEKLQTVRTSVDEKVLRDMVASLGTASPTVNRDVDLTINANDKARIIELVEPRRLTVRLALRGIKKEAFWIPLRIHYVAATDDASTARRLRFSPLAREEKYAPPADGQPARVRLFLEGTPVAMTELDEARLHAFVLESDVGADQESAANLEVRVLGLPFGVRISDPVLVSVEVVH